ncbi:MAG: PEF-CTERM sorting domain-containing protein [Archaeoglobaceae archaeon]
MLLLTASAASASYVSLGKETPPGVTVTDGDEVTYSLNACNPTDTQGTTPINQTITITDTYPDGSSEVLATDVHLEPGECWTDTTTYTVTGTEELEDGKIVNGLEVSGVDEAGDDVGASVEHKNPYEEPAPTPTPEETPIPEFPTIAIPVIGMLAILAIMTRR